MSTPLAPHEEPKSIITWNRRHSLHKHALDKSMIFVGFYNSTRSIFDAADPAMHQKSGEAVDPCDHTPLKSVVPYSITN